MYDHKVFPSAMCRRMPLSRPILSETTWISYKLTAGSYFAIRWRASGSVCLAEGKMSLPDRRTPEYHTLTSACLARLCPLDLAQRTVNRITRWELHV